MKTFILTIFLGAFPLLAQSECDALLVDNAHVIGATGTKNINVAAESLMAAGADVRVRTEKDLGGYPTPQHLEQALEKSCASWRSPNGDRKSNLIVIMFVKPDWSAIIPGREFGSVLADQQLAIARDLMSPKIRANNYAGALTAGLKGVKDVLGGKRIQGSPSAATTKPTQVIHETKIIHEAPTDYSGVASFFKWLLFVCVVGGIAFAAFKFFTRNKAEKETRQGAQQNAQLARAEVVELINKMNNDFPAFEILTKDTDANRVNRVNNLLSSASESFAALGKMSMCDPTQDGLPEARYENMAMKFGNIKTDLRTARALMDGVTDPTGPAASHHEMPASTPTPMSAPTAHVPYSQPHPSPIPPTQRRPRPHGGGNPGGYNGPRVIHETTVINEGGIIPTTIPVFIPEVEHERHHPWINDDPLGDRIPSRRDDPEGVSMRAGRSDDDDNSGISLRAGSINAEEDTSNSSRGPSTTY